VLIFALGVGVFLPIRDHAWLNYDDNVYVTQSEPVRAGLGWDGVRWAFTSYDGANWFPLTRLSWMIDAELRGLDSGGFLATNLLLHALASALLFAALARLTQRPLRSAFVAAVFAVHPLHVESVAWVAARKDPLSALFFFAACFAYAIERERGTSPARSAAVIVCATLGLMAKPIVVTLPFVLLLFDGWPLQRMRGGSGAGRFDWRAFRTCVVEKWPLFTLAGVFSAITVAAQRSGGAVASLEQVALFDRVANAAVSCATYLGRAFWPTDLAVFYPHTGDALEVRGVLGAVALLVGISAFAWQQRTHRPFVAFGWLWFLLTLAPVIGIVQVGSQAMADRYTYLPLVGIAVAVTWGVSDAAARLPARRILLSIVACAAIVAQVALTSSQLRHWRDSEALFRHALAVTQDNHVAHSYLGAALLDRGETAEAIAQFREALRLRSDLLTVTNNLAWLLATGSDPRHRDPLAAIALAERAAELTQYRDPAVLDTLAAAYASAGRFEAAVRIIDRALDLVRGADVASVDELEGRRARYRRGRTYIEPPR
jgi:tetratricopeptide (TPR) repeat protein